MTGLRILALLTDGIGAAGGIARYNTDLLTALAASCAVSQVTVVPRFGKATAEPIECVLQRSSQPRAAIWAMSAASVALTRRFDVIFCGHLNSAPFAAALARMTGRTLWIQTHGIEAWAPRGPLFRNAMASARLVTSVSRFTRTRLLSWCDIDPTRVRVLPNTVGAIAGRSQRPASLEQRLGLQGARVVLTVGRLAAAERYKGHDRVIEALPETLKQVPEARYVIVGTGDDLPRLRDVAEICGVGDRVVFATAKDPSELADYFQLADVFAMPSTGEGFGIVFLEAAAAGLPVIGGNCDGSVDALADGAVGTLVDPHDRTGLVDALVAGLSGRLRTGMDAVRRFGFHNFAKEVDDLVRNHL